MGELASCSLAALSFMGLIIGGVIASISFSMYKKGKTVVIKEVKQYSS